MAGKTTLATLVLVVVAAAALMEGAAAAVHFVGNTTGWTIPTGGAAFYSTWAASQTFAVGDILVFNFINGAHDVATVTKTSYDSCNSTSPISLLSTPPVNITLTASGEHYYICTFGQHCASGQKLTVNVPTAGSPTPTPSPSPASPTPTPSTTPSPTPSATPAPTPAAPTPSPPAHSPAPSSAPTNSPPPPPAMASPPPSSSPSPPGSTSPSPTESTSPPPPPPSSASHKAVAAFGMVVMSVAIGALF